MSENTDRSAWPDGPIIVDLPKGENVIDALPAMLRRIRIANAYNIPAPRGDATILPMKRTAS